MPRDSRVAAPGLVSGQANSQVRGICPVLLTDNSTVTVHQNVRSDKGDDMMARKHRSRKSDIRKVSLGIEQLEHRELLAADVPSFDLDGDGRSDIAFHRPGGNWESVPALISQGDGGLTSTNNAAPSWANQPGVISLAGDYNGDGKSDIAFHRPGSDWESVPILFSKGDGSWSFHNYGEQVKSQSLPDWPNQPDVIALPGDYNGDGKTDIAFHRPCSSWESVPILFSQGNGNWTYHNYGDQVKSQSLPSWANQPGVKALPGDYDNDGKTDIAFHRPGSNWASVPVLLSEGNGSWSPNNYAAPSWANQSGTVAIAGDYDGDGKQDIAFHRPDYNSNWESVPVLFSQGNGRWRPANYPAPSWANRSYMVAVPGDYNGDGKTDIAFKAWNPMGATDWVEVYVLCSQGNGSFRDEGRDYAVLSGFYNDVIALPGDYNNDGKTDIAFHHPGSNGHWTFTHNSVPTWFNKWGVIAITGD